MLSDNIKQIMNREVDLSPLPRAATPPARWNEQLEEACFWFCAVSCLLLISLQAYIGLYFNGNYSLTDYGSLYASASYANLHADPYRDHPLVFHLRDINHYAPDTKLQGTSVNAINLNPPVVLYPFRLLARLTPDVSFNVWKYISVGLFVASVLLVLQMYPAENLRIRILWILSLGAVWYTFRLGQIYMILLFFAVLAWRALRSQNWLAAGISIGVICAIKPNFLIWPGLLIAGKSKKTGFTAFATTAALSAIPLAFQGPLIYRRWLAACRGFNGYELPGNSSLLAIFSRAGFPGVGFAATFLMLAAVTIWVFITKPEPLFNSEIGILATLFAGPISWLGYSILLLPVLYGKSMDKLTRIGCVLLCIPIWVAIPWATTTRLMYIFLWAPHFYGLALIAFSAVRTGAYREEFASAPARLGCETPLPAGSKAVLQSAGWKIEDCIPLSE